ncbi:glycoside hydrolase family 5 protein [Hypholoma sublateritium FD-334 SS-4]|uniref:glucan 1,3-beta-glucosidase n=1 Tax=Hypholoma sublateritium (strain FD-334 SS-4) TaxID=945553 RepID=A0A0D2NWW9_HYPSF|nr:glycoside hydrolase family 5 protein [Hypholoma sublateritium FD-334 SS-4]
MAHYKSLSLTGEVEMANSPRHSTADLNDPWNDELVNMYTDGRLYQPASNAETPLQPNTPSKAVLARRMNQRKQNPRRRRNIWIVLGVAAIVVIAAAVVVGVILSKKHSSEESSSSSSSSGSSGSAGTSGSGSTNSATSGKTGSKIKMDDGTTFTYTNNFGGDWAMDPTSPFAAGGKAQTWSPRIGSEDWVWGEHIARGVNLGGWLVTEPFISPALYEEYVNSSSIPVVDEWSLSLAMGSDLATKMEAHYKTFITEQDFADIAAAGLNYVRIPLGFWAIETINDEPFLVGTSWKYFLKAIEWGRKYGIRIFLDLHALPGSQNGWNHSGKSGSVNFMNGVMGLANAERTLTYLRIITEFISQPQYRDVVGIFGIVNEILWATIGETSVQSFYLAAYDAIRNSTGVGAGSGPYIAIHEGFQGPAIWEGFLSGADRLTLDQHPYLAFTGDTSPIDQMALKPCGWAVATNQSQSVFGVTVGGEFATAINNCGLWLNGIGSTPSSPDCATWDNWSAYSAATIASLQQVTLASMDALQNFFFWTWKIGNSTVLGTSSCPMWHYQLGLQQGWIPKDPRAAIGHCAQVLSSSQLFNGNYPATATGGTGAGTIAPTQLASHTFPPASIMPSFTGTQVALLPTYTPTGSLKTLPGPTFTAAPSATVGMGWNNAADNQPAYVPISGCTYPDPWNAVSSPLPSTTCGGN